MSKHRNRAWKKQEGRIVEGIWKTAIDEGFFSSIHMQHTEDELTRLLHHFTTIDLEVGNLHYQLAMQYRQLNHFDEAATHMEQALIAYWWQLEHDDPELLRVQIVFAAMCREAEQFGKAIRILEESLRIIQDDPHPEYPGIPEVIRELILVFRAQEKYFRAIELLDLLSTLDVVDQEDKVTYLNRQLELASAYRQAGLTVDAINLLYELLEQYASILPATDGEMIPLKRELACCYIDLGCPQAALEWLDEVFEFELRQKSYAHLDIAYLLEIQAMLYLQLGRWDRGLPRLREAYQQFRLICGEEDPHTRELKQRLEAYE